MSTTLKITLASAVALLVAVEVVAAPIRTAVTEAKYRAHLRRKYSMR